MLLLISYDLPNEGRPSGRDAVEKAIKEVATETRNPIFSVWLVDTDEDIEAWQKRLTPLMTPQDRLLIVPIQSAVNGWLPTANWEWINQHRS